MKRKEGMIVFLFLVIVLFIIFFLFNTCNLKIKDNTDNIIITNNTIQFDSLTLKQKIAQMIIVYGDNKNNLELTKLNIGGIFLDNQENEENYKNLINQYQKNSKIKLIVATDMEGAWNPFSDFQSFSKFSEIKTAEEAYNIGFEEGKLLKEIGFNFNFAPVSEYEDGVYNGRTFLGTEEEIQEKLSEYIKGLQKEVRGTCKHYPGKGMINNLHEQIDIQDINEEDLELFKVCLNNNISAIMIGHQIVLGEVNSKNIPSSVSSEVIDSLSNFSGLIISDEINMKGLKDYLPNKLERYIQLINSGENLILDFENNLNYNKLLIDLEKLTRQGKINEEKINESVRKILIAKGYTIQ